MRSLTGTLFRGVILGTAFVLMMAGTILYISVNRQLISQMDESLTDKVRTLALSIEEKPYGLEVDLEEMRAEDMEEAESPEYIYISSMDGRTIYRSDRLGSYSLSGFPAPLAGPRHDWHIIKGAGKVRSVLFSFNPEVDDEEENLESVATDSGIVIDKSAKPGDQIVIQLFKETPQHRRFMEMFLFILLATGLGSIGVLSLTIWLAIKRGAEPINELASRIEEISDDDLRVRLDEDKVLNELVPIVHKLNVFLDRIERSFSREKGFTSDAAHELRTPLAGLKSTIEVALTRKRESGEYQETLERALEIVNQLESLVKNLLALARLESGQEAPQIFPIEIKSCIRDAWMSYNQAAEEMEIDVSLNLHNGDMALIDRELLIQVVDEIFKNALYYVDQGGSIKINLLHQDGSTQFRVSNTGSKVSGEEASRVFDRFWRGSQSRGGTGVRFGLGLPIARKIVETMGVRMEVETEMDGEFVVTLTMPEGNRTE